MAKGKGSTRVTLHYRHHTGGHRITAPHRQETCQQFHRDVNERTGSEDWTPARHHRHCSVGKQDFVSSYAPIVGEQSTLPLEGRQPRTEENMRKERTNTRTMHYRLALPLIIAYFAGLVLLSGSRSDAAPVASEENRRSTGRESSSRGASNEEKAFPWRAVPVILTPTTNNRRRGLGSETPAEATAPTSNVDVGSTNSTGETDTETAMGGAFGVLGDWRDSVSLPEGGEGGKLGLRGEACLEPGKQEEVREIFRRRRETPAGEKVAACVRTKDAGRFLPEWIAYHQAIGVDELTLYDDDSVDETKKIIQPFVDAGLVMYLFKEVGKRRYQMQPLNHCLKRHMERRAVDSSAPVWVLFHDVDEYMFPVQTNLTMSQALMRHPTTCCVQVPRVQYGTSGLQQQPRGLLLETFLKHAHPGVFTNNRYPKVAVNLEPTDPSLGLIKPPLFNMHDAEGCTCEKIDVTDMRINHYLGSAEDYLQKTKRFWQENHNREKVEENLKTRDINAETSDTITTWACATRETLFRVVNGIDLELGLDRQTTEQRAL